MKLGKIIAALFGGTVEGPKLNPPLLPVPPPEEASSSGDSRFHFYNTFNLRDGRLLVEELEKLGLPFEIELNDGVQDVNVQFGSAGQMARMTIYIEPENADILDDLVRLHFHLGNKG